MKVDMSSEAVGARLRTVGNLWLLSVEIMNSESLDGRSLSHQRSAEIVNAIRDVLYKNWDPLDVADHSSPDEYDAYIAPVYRVLVGSRLENHLVETLRRIEREEMGIDTSSIEKLRLVANKLLELSVTLD